MRTRVRLSTGLCGTESRRHSIRKRTSRCLLDDSSSRHPGPTEPHDRARRSDPVNTGPSSAPTPPPSGIVLLAGALCLRATFALAQSGADHDGATAAAVANPADPVVFEASLINFARGYENHGCYVTASGNVFHYQYDRRDRHWDPKRATDGTLAAADMLERHSHQNLLTGRIPQSELAARTALIASAAQGPFERKGHTAYDAGSYVMEGWLFDPSTERYASVMLVQRGDFSGSNQSPHGAALLQWLNDALKSASCTP